MAEYALLTSAIALVVVGALAGVGTALPRTSSQATALVARTAQSAGVSPVNARRALTGAPYQRPSLRALWGIGWVAGKRDAVTCVLQRTLGRPTEPAAREALGRVAGLRAKLRKAGLTERAAVTAVDRGYRASCAR